MGYLRIIVILTWAAIIFFPLGIRASEQPVLNIVGATTVQPIIQALASDYYQHSGQKISVEGGGTSTGIARAQEGDAYVGMASRALTQEEKDELEYTTIGMDALVFIANKRNPLESIDRETVIRIFSGEIQDWSGPADWNHPVTLVSKELGRSTLELFQEYSGLHHQEHPEPGENGRISEKAHEIASNLDGITLVGGTPGGIGYMSLGASRYLQDKGMPIKILQLDGYSLDEKSVVAGEYPINRELNLVYQEKNQELVQEFIQFCLGSRGQEAVRELGYIPVQEY